MRVQDGSTGPRTPYMRDVARLAGVSHQTVSRVVNGSPHVLPETRARVQRAADTPGYVHDPWGCSGPCRTPGAGCRRT